MGIKELMPRCTPSTAERLRLNEEIMIEDWDRVVFMRRLNDLLGDGFTRTQPIEFVGHPDGHTTFYAILRRSK